MARRLCRLPRLFLAASAPAAPKPRHLPVAVNPSPAPYVPSFSTPAPALPALSRLFSSSAGGSAMVVVGSSDSFTSILSKVQDEKLPAVFYYTAAWCGPCRAIAPVISKLSEKYPNIPVYKVDIDMDGLGSKLTPLKIFSVNSSALYPNSYWKYETLLQPTFHFYHKGEKASEVVGADVKKLEASMESLHNEIKISKLNLIFYATVEVPEELT
ncbi:hypothetical protein EJB05_41860, partial [Eragrostis curvula]